MGQDCVFYILASLVSSGIAQYLAYKTGMINICISNINRVERKHQISPGDEATTWSFWKISDPVSTECDPILAPA